MHNEEKLKQELIERFGFSADQVRLTRPRRIFLETSLDQFRSLLEHAVQQMEFRHLCTITGLDEGETLAFFYHLARADGIVLNLKTRLPKSQAELPTVTDIFPGSMIYERELVDLFGVRVAGLPEGQRYPLPDNWPVGQYPLRKDFNMEAVQKTDQQRKEDAHG